jgi:predicted AlkP superfamily pyrophosphatase or phosphodiesterase
MRMAVIGLISLMLSAITGTSMAAQTANRQDDRKPVTILISIDGFRADYLGRGLTPTLSALAKGGVTGPMRPSFPTKTYASHYSIVTGLHPDRHGIVGNRFEDPAHPGLMFTMAAHKESFWWDQAEPIWVAAEKAGIPSAPLFWPGSDVKIQGTWASAWQHYDVDVTGHQRVDAAIDLLRRPDATRPRLLTLYFDEVDTQGHRYGPDSPELTAALKQVDATMAYLRAQLATLEQSANLVIVADHGMIATDPSRVIMIDQIADPADFHVVDEGPSAMIAPTPGREEALAAKLLAPHPHYSCMRKEDLPAHLHYGRNPRVAAFVCLAEPGWLLLGKIPTKGVDLGSHGYDNQEPGMLALFIANGPAFAADKQIPTFDSVDIYPLLRDLIGLPPKADIDGKDAPFKGTLRPR